MATGAIDVDIVNFHGIASWGGAVIEMSSVGIAQRHKNAIVGRRRNTSSILGLERQA